MSEQHMESLKGGAKVLELGCGTGIPGMCVRLLGGSVTLTEQPQLVPLLQKNLDTNFQGDAGICARELSVRHHPFILAPLEGAKLFNRPTLHGSPFAAFARVLWPSSQAGPHHDRFLRARLLTSYLSHCD